MNPKQLEIKNLLDSTPRAWGQFVAADQKTMRETLRPEQGKGFTPEQRELLKDRYLPITPEQLAQAQALLPPLVGIIAIADVDGGLWLNADLLTDCVQPGDTYHAIAPILGTLPITLLSSDQFPPPESADL